MAKLFGYPINVEADEEEGGGGSSINAEASRSCTQPDGGATSLPQRESNPYFRFLETNSDSGSAPMDSGSDPRDSFIDFLGRVSNEVDDQMQRVACDVDICGGSDVIELGLRIGAGSGLQVTGYKETDSGRVDVGTDLSPSEDDLFCEEEDMLMADEVLEWETLQNDITWESEPVQASLFSRLEEEEEEEEEEVEEEEEEEVEEEDTEEEEEEEEEEEGDELALPSRANPPLQSLESQFLSLVNNDGLVEDFYEESLDAMLMEAMEMEGASLMDLDYGDILHELGEDPGDFYDVFAQSISQEPPIMGTRPASKRVVDDLPVVEITSEEFSKGSIACAICIGDVVVEEKVTRLPCRHYYHGECILPWLGMKNTCPVCRYELPTDDLEYERNRRS